MIQGKRTEEPGITSDSKDKKPHPDAIVLVAFVIGAIVGAMIAIAMGTFGGGAV